jgi:hypothetical protein
MLLASVFTATVVYVDKRACIRIPAPPPSDVVVVDVEGRRFRARYRKIRVRSGGREYVYHYLSLGSSIEALQLLGRTLKVRLLASATTPAKAVATTAELPALPRQYLTLPCAEKILKFLELAGGCIDARTSDIGLAVMCAASTIKAALKKLKEEGRVTEYGWRICVSRQRAN